MVLKNGKYLQLKACSAKSLSSIPMAILLPPDDMALVENALYLDSRHTVHYLVFLVVIRVQSSMKCIICFVLGSSGEFKTRSGVTLIQVGFFYDQSSAVYNMTLRLEFVFKLNYKIHLYALRNLVWL